jgi:hypothetical protein
MRSPITYYSDWRLTPAWVARVLSVYAAAAICGGLIFFVCMLVFR